MKEKKFYTIILGETVGQGSPYDKVLGKEIAVGYKDLIKKLKEIKKNQFGFKKLPIYKTLKKKKWNVLTVEGNSFGNLNYSGYWLDIIDECLDDEIIKEKYEGWW